MATDKSLLDADQDAFYENLLLQAANEAGVKRDELQSTAHFKKILPKPGFCLKTKTDKNDKIFINVCQDETIPEPKDLSDDDLLRLLDSDDQSGYRVPMSIGDAHTEVDNSGQSCAAYDVIINNKFFQKLEAREVLMGFVLTLVLEGLEYKYGLNLSREWKMMKNRKFMGTLEEQHVREKHRPLIMDLDSSETNLIKKPLVQELSGTEEKASNRRIPEPPYTIMQEPPTGHPDFLAAEIHLPKVKVAGSMTLDIGEDRILLETRSNIYLLDIFLPFNIIQENTTAQFNRKTKILTVTMPVQANS